MLLVFLEIVLVHSDCLASAYKNHITKCGARMTSSGRAAAFAGGSGMITSRSLGTTYDKYGRAVADNGLAEKGYIEKGALNRILSNSLESGLSLDEASHNASMGAFNANISPTNPFVGSHGYGLELASGRNIKGYRERGDENLLETNNPAILDNINCKFPSNGYGHIYCTNDKIIGEHYDLSNMIGPYRINAHYESPSKVEQPLHQQSYHQNAYKDMLMQMRLGFTDHDLLHRNMANAQRSSNCKMRQPSHQRGVDRFITPADEFHEV